MHICILKKTGNILKLTNFINYLLSGKMCYDDIFMPFIHHRFENIPEIKFITKVKKYDMRFRARKVTQTQKKLSHTSENNNVQLS